MAEEIGFKLNVDPGNSEKSVKSFKAELKEANEAAIQMSRKFGEFSPQAIAAAAAVGKLKDEMQDTQALAKSLTDENRFASFAGFAGSIAGGFTAAQGAITLATGESKQFEEALVKVQAAMALSQGLTQVAEIGKMYNNAKAAASSFTIVQKANTAATSVATTITKLFGAEVDTGSKSFGRLKTAITATGIGLLVTVIGYVIANFNSLKDTIYKLLPFLETVEKFIGMIVTAVTDFVGITSEATRAADELTESIKRQNEINDATVQILEASGAKQSEIRKFKRDAAQEEINDLLKVQKLKGELSEDETKRLKELKLQQVLLNAEQAKEDRDAAEAAAKKADEDHKKALEKQKEEAKKLAEQKKKQAEDAQKAADEATQAAIDAQKEQHKYELDLAKTKGEDVVKLRQKQIDDEIYVLQDSGDKYKSAIVALEHEKVLVAEQARAEAEKKAEEDRQKRAEQQAQIKSKLDERESQRLQKVAEDKKFQDADANAAAEAYELANVQAKYDAMKSVVAGNEQLLTQVIDAEAEARATVTKKWDDITLEHKKQQVAQIGGLLSNASALFGKATVAGKAIAIADTTIKTYQGATAALAASAGTGPWGVALGIANAAIVVASGLKSVKDIVSTKVPNASDSASGSISAPSPSTSSSPAVSTAPTMDGIQSTLITQNKQLSAGNDPLRAYVVESDITQKQERQRAITQTANF